MDIRDLVRSLLTFDALTAREWVQEAVRSGVVWKEIGAPIDLSPRELALAAGVIELLAQRSGEQPPSWTSTIGSVPGSMYLVQAAHTMPRLRRSCESEGPEPLRKRGFFAPPEFLTFA